MSSPIALFDIDNTIYDGFSYFGLLEKQVDEGIVAQNTLDKARSCMLKYTSKLQNYEVTTIELLDIYAAGLKGTRYSIVLESTTEFFRSNSDKFFSYVKPVIERLEETHRIVLVTGEPQFVAEVVGNIYDVHAYFSSRYEVDSGIFTGNTMSYLATRHEKHEAISQLTKTHNMRTSFAFGDSESDVEMLRSVGYPICLNPTDELKHIAVKNGWHIPNINDVSALVVQLHNNH